MSDTDTRLGKILDDAFEMGRGLHPEDYTNLRSGMLKKAEALFTQALTTLKPGCVDCGKKRCENCERLWQT